MVAVLFCIVAAAGAVRAETVTLAGSGGMVPLLTELGKAYMKRHPGNVIQVSPQSITQSGGILAVKSGSIDIGMSARNLTDAEKNGSIEAFLIAKVAAEVAVHRNVRVRNLSSRQLCDIYSGKIDNWKVVGGHDARMVVLTKPDSDSTKQAFRTGVACFRELKEGPAVAVMIKSSDIFNALVSIPDSIGLIDSVVLSQAKGRARAVTIDGRGSSPRAIAAGRWPAIKHYNLILRKERSRAVDNFMRFIASREGEAVIRRNGGVPVRFAYR